MGYFSNGTEGDLYESRYCNRCVHEDDEKGCPVMLAHILYAYELCNEEKHPGKVMLDLLIPRSKDGCGNEQCVMFHPKGSPDLAHAKREIARSWLYSMPSKMQEGYAVGDNGEPIKLAERGSKSRKAKS